MKPSWKDAPAWAKYLAMDENGGWFWFEEKPTFVHSVWKYTDTDNTARYESAGIVAVAKFSLEERPNE